MLHLRNWYEEKSLKLIILGIIVHVSLFFGALDVYFSSPVEHGLTSFKANCSLADRAVIFIADGLRYEAVDDIYSDLHTPFLNKIRRENVSWGICFTRVPTESRPGHVALFGGMYEDPSAVLSGWKHNPINVDNVFNQSDESWLWGSPDIVPMFNRDNLKKINTFCYDASFERFSGGISTIELDRWVIENVKKFFLTSADCNKSTCKSLFGGGKVFFLHLLGMDTVGHVFKPNSREYFENLKYVDDAVQEIYNLFEKFYGDNRTAYIFTSDHGMTDWGSHGSGSFHETQSPFITWGSGFKDLSYSYKIYQADVAPLISVLLGINIPTNSAGLIPYAHLNTTDEEAVHILYANLRQLGERFNRRHERIERATLYGLFKPFNRLNKHIYYNKIHEIEDSIDGKGYKSAKKEILALLELIQEGDKYISQYYKYPLLFSLSIALMLWMIYLMLQIIPCSEKESFASKNCILRCVINYNIVLVALAGALFYNGIRFKYWFYIFFPSSMILPLLYELNQLIYLITFLKSLPKYRLIINMLVWSVGMSSLIYSFYYETYIVLPVLSLILWGISERQYYRSEDIWFWIIINSSVCLYPTLSKLIKDYSTLQTIAAYFLVSHTLIIHLKNICNEKTSSHLFYYHITKIVLLTMAVLSTMINTILQNSLQFHICIATWFILFASFLLAALSPGTFVSRCCNISVLFYAVYTLMSNSGESLFLVLFISVQLQWLFFETHLWNKKKCADERISELRDKESEYDDFRRCLFFICFILLSYFGAGNLANMNTFDPMWARQFVLVFNPFLSAVIILFKITIPFLIATIFFQAANSYTKTPTIKVFPIIMLYCEVLVMYFMNSIENEGSWLFIGLSISRFVIVSLMTSVLLIFYGISRFLTQNKLFDTFAAYSAIMEARKSFEVNNL